MTGERLETNHEPLTDELSEKTAEDAGKFCNGDDARADVRAHGLPPTPARWQRRFNWGYAFASLVLEELRAEVKAGTLQEPHKPEAKLPVEQGPTGTQQQQPVQAESIEDQVARMLENGGNGAAASVRILADLTERLADELIAQKETGEQLNETKYCIREGRLVNRQSGEAIPDDEPVFVLRAQDLHAIEAIRFYRGVCQNREHKERITEVVDRFATFKNDYPARVREPD